MIKTLIFFVLICPLSLLAHSHRYQDIKLRSPEKVQMKSLVCFTSETLERDSIRLFIDSSEATVIDGQGQSKVAPVENSRLIYFWRSNQQNIIMNFDGYNLDVRDVNSQKEKLKAGLSSHGTYEDLTCVELVYSK